MARTGSRFLRNGSRTQVATTEIEVGLVVRAPARERADQQQDDFVRDESDENREAVAIHGRR